MFSIKIPATYEDALNSIHAQRWQEALNDEISSIVSKGTYEVVPRPTDRKAYAPVCDQTTRRVLFAIAAEQKLHMHQLDVKTAFLNGELTELTFCEPPPGFAEGKGKVWKLKKAL